MKPVDLNCSNAFQTLTLHVRLRGLRVLALRMWAGRLLIRLAARVLGCGLVVEEE